MEIVEALEEAVASTNGIVKGVRDEQLSLATPCTDWNVRDLMNHMLATLWRSDGVLRDVTPKVDGPPFGLPSEDLVGDDPLASYAQASAAALVAARRPGALRSVHTTPVGDLPGSIFAVLITTDQFVHGWDLARATAQLADFDAALATYLLEQSRPLVTDDVRSAVLGPEMEVAPDAPAIDRLVGFLGRRP
jgi:uncharacterized protein (TIGR03086 family)